MAIKLLLVDDDPDIRTLAVTVLARSREFEVQTAESGEQGLAIALETKPDLILLDRRMPEWDGVTTFDRLREAGLDTPVIFLTADASPTEIAEHHDLGALGTIRKPFQPGSLASQIKTFIETLG